ncbi:hypothetical protein AX769_14155 [Frondihabitans sp. PAMC 28766]|nr:hypothetical protein AX769_14155 [Frondihabitans sp. PAMC 28766]
MATSLLVFVDVLAAVLVVLLVRRPRRRPAGRAWSRHVVIGIPLGLAIGWAAIWLIGDVLDVFEVSPTTVQRIWTSLMVAGVVLAVINLLFAPARRKVLALGGAAVFVLAGGLAINRDVGEYRTLGQLMGVEDTQSLALPALVQGAAESATTTDLASRWHAPSDLPARGRVGSVRIAGTHSSFVARDAIVYLPPAALVKDPPRLPVVILMTGQPGSPSSVLISGEVQTTLDADAAAHRGLAPIVVVPDQLSSADANPLCVDGPLGNSATYLTKDVPDWIRAHLNVQAGRSAWSVGGFSQGGTCAVQFATSHPDLFGSFIDVSAQLGPRLSSTAATIADGFGGDESRYRAAQPEAIMAAHGPYPDTVAFFAVGRRDARYTTVMNQVSAAAGRAQMHVTRYVSPGSGHDWVTASNGFAHGFAVVWSTLGLGTFRGAA